MRHDVCPHCRTDGLCTNPGPGFCPPAASRRHVADGPVRLPLTHRHRITLRRGGGAGLSVGPPQMPHLPGGASTVRPLDLTRNQIPFGSVGSCPTDRAVLFGTGMRSHALTRSLRTTCAARDTRPAICRSHCPLLVSAGRPAAAGQGQALLIKGDGRGPYQNNRYVPKRRS